jgi:hypothetical protein
LQRSNQLGSQDRFCIGENDVEARPIAARLSWEWTRLGYALGMAYDDALKLRIAGEASTQREMIETP